MTETVKIELQPLGETIETPKGTPLREILFDYGVEFPCGGRGQCRGCRIRVLEGHLPVTPCQEEILKPKELEDGWRLSCQCRAEEPLKLELSQWKADILVDDSLFEFTPQDGLGIAVDLGTTTIVAQLLDLATGQALGIKTALNAQARHGSDVMSRVEFAVTGDGAAVLRDLIRKQIGTLAAQVIEHAHETASLDRSDSRPITQVSIVGNTVMHHLFCGLDLEPLSHYPFEPPFLEERCFSADELGWSLPGNPQVRFLACLGGFVGSDILAGILACKLHESEDLVGLVDLGTNGEIVFGNRHGMICASTAAGPAFEGARIWMGMRAATGAIYQVKPDNGSIKCSVLGNAVPRGICGSGLVDAVSTGLDLGIIHSRGKLENGQDKWILAEPVAISQTDIRQLQLAKGAIAAGIKVILDRIGAKMEDVSRLYLAGAFGNYISKESAARIGLLAFDRDKIHPSGNTALLGAKMSLFHAQPETALHQQITQKIEHISLSSDARFMDIYVEEMLFP